MTKLREALEVLRARGWTQADYFDANGSVCLTGAINFAHVVAVNCHSVASCAAYGHTDRDQDIRTLKKVLESEYPHESLPLDIENYNDCVLTTAEEAERALEKAAVLAEEQL